MLAIKKTLHHPRADEVKRVRFQCQLLRYEYFEGRSIVYLDESGFAVDSPRPNGYAKKGKRCYGSYDWHARGRLNAIGAIMNDEWITACLWDCYVDGEVFYLWLTRDLLPKLPNNTVIVMDGASFHTAPHILNTIEAAGHTPMVMPPYSPDLNPIERKWGQLKAKRRQLRCDPFQLFDSLKYAELY